MYRRVGYFVDFGFFVKKEVVEDIDDLDPSA